jgi:hypothetical protein
VSPPTQCHHRRSVITDVVALHDLVDIPGWTHGRQVRSALGRNKVLIATLINSLFPGLAAALALYYWQRPAPTCVSSYWIIYCAVTVVSAASAWWIPYFRGADESTKEYRVPLRGAR